MWTASIFPASVLWTVYTYSPTTSCGDLTGAWNFSFQRRLMLSLRNVFWTGGNVMEVNAYLTFDGKCEEALEFYKSKLGAKVTALMRFKEAPDQSQIKPESKDKVMHSEFQVGETKVMASDGYCTGKPSFSGFSLV